MLIEMAARGAQRSGPDAARRSRACRPGTGYRRSDQPRAAASLPSALTAKTPLADGVIALTLVPADGGVLPPWEPGAHVDLHLAPGLIRPYSLCGDPADRAQWRVAVLRELGPGAADRISCTPP